MGRVMHKSEATIGRKRLLEFIDYRSQEIVGMPKKKGRLSRTSSVYRGTGGLPEGSTISGQHFYAMTLNAMQSFLGSLKYHRRTIEDYAVLFYPLRTERGRPPYGEIT